jgi:DNA modification methylase
MMKESSLPTTVPGAQADHGLQVVYRRIRDLKPDPRNPRKHSKTKIRRLAGSIKHFGFNVPVLIGRDSTVVAGHARLLACLELGLKEIATICVDHLDEGRLRAFMIADNRLAETATWDDRVLAEHLRDLTQLDLDFNIEITGFEMGEIDLRIASLDEKAAAHPAGAIEPSDASVEPSDVGEEPARASSEPADDDVGPAGIMPVSKPGDLWLLGQHRMGCASILDLAAVQNLMAEERAAMVFSDPPYNVPIDGHATGLGNIHHRSFAMAAGEMSPPAFAVYLATSLRNQAAFCFGGSLLYVCMDWRHIDAVLAAGRDIKAELQNLCVWVKDNGGMGSLYRSQHELIFVFKTGRGPHRNNVQLGRFGRNRSNVWQYAGVNSFRRNTEEGNLLALHPTVKPVQMVADAILDCTARGDVVLDGFLGSGTTLIAAERTGRRCFGLELDPGYVDTAIRRWQKLTGGVVRHAVDGRRFGDVAEAEVADAA